MSAPDDSDESVRPDPAYAGGVRPLTGDDLDWVLTLGTRRRERLAADAPRFWRPAPDAGERQREHLQRVLASGSPGLRTDHGYLVAADGERHVVVDDMEVAEAAWPEEGTAMLRHVLRRGRPVRLVVPLSEPERRAAAVEAGFGVGEVWWHKDLPLTRVTRERGRVELRTPGAVGRLVDAPPVHDPGGPVLLVTEAEQRAALTAIESDAASRGATVSVVPQAPDDLIRELLLVEAGYRKLLEFLVST